MDKDYKFTKVSREKLVPYVNNSRTHSEEQIKQIAASMMEWGFTNPVLIDESNGIIAGHGRVQAAALCGIDQIPCIVLEGLTEAQKKGYVIADNRLPLSAGWDTTLLSMELTELGDMDFDIDLLGFDDAFLSDLFNEIGFEDKNKEIDLDDFDDNVELIFKLSIEQYESVKEKLFSINPSIEIALLTVLKL